MSKKAKKLTGKDHAKLNKRKKFYEKLERFYNKLIDSDENVVFLSMNKNISFPEFDALSIILNKNCVDLEEEIEVEKKNTLEIVYFEEAHFLLEASKLNLVTICRQETQYNNEGRLRKGLTASKEEYDYQKAFNWGIRLDKKAKFAKSIAKEKLDPTWYDLTPPKAIILEPIHYKSKKPPRRKRR